MAACFLPLCSIIFTILIGALILSSTVVHPATLEADTSTLQLLKDSIDPSSIAAYSYLNTWDFAFDPCETTGGRFLGILCAVHYDNSTTRITSLNLDAAGYDGFLTASLGNLTELTSLDLSQNRFRGPIPESIAALKKLVWVSMAGNFFTGNIPPGIGDFTELEYLDLTNNRLSGTLPPKLARLRSLTRILLSKNELVGRIPDLTGAWQLDTLEINSNLLYGDLPPLPVSLTNLNLAHNLLTGTVSQVERLRKLTSCDLSDNRLSSYITKGLLTLPLVKHVNVSFNQFTGLEVPSFSEIETQLQVFDAHENRIRGPLPVLLVTAENLTTINLSHNRFSGPIPKEYGTKLPRWKRLFLDHNYLSGSLPREFRISPMGLAGSLAANCLNCPVKYQLCHGKQRPSSDCIGHTKGH